MSLYDVFLSTESKKGSYFLVAKVLASKSELQKNCNIFFASPEKVTAPSHPLRDVSRPEEALSSEGL